MTDTIRISGIEVRATHGVLESEKTTEQTFLVDLEIGIDLTEAGTSDELSATVDYGELARETHDYVAANSFDLIERLATGIADLVLEYPAVDTAKVTVHKPEAPIDVPFSDVSVTVERRA